MCIAPTGSGKTLAYLLPTLVRMVDPARIVRGTEGGMGIRTVVVVPTHDLAIQIKAVLKVISRGRAWRCMVLTKATEKAICESSPGRKFSQSVKRNDEDEDEEVDQEDPEAATDIESTGSTDEFEVDRSQSPSDGTDR